MAPLSTVLTKLILIFLTFYLNSLNSRSHIWLSAAPNFSALAVLSLTSNAAILASIGYFQTWASTLDYNDHEFYFQSKIRFYGTPHNLWDHDTCLIIGQGCQVHHEGKTPRRPAKIIGRKNQGRHSTRCLLQVTNIPAILSPNYQQPCAPSLILIRTSWKGWADLPIFGPVFSWDRIGSSHGACMF